MSRFFFRRGKHASGAGHKSVGVFHGKTAHGDHIAGFFDADVVIQGRPFPCTAHAAGDESHGTSQP